jgi:hypothetical protein
MAGLVCLVVFAALGWGRLAGRRQRWLSVAALAAAVVIQAAGAFVVVRRYWGGAGLDRLAALTAYSPWPVGVLAVVSVLLVAALAATAWELARRPAERAV